MVEVCLKRLTGLNKPFKYVVTCVIMQKNGAGLHTASSCYWDNTTDGEWVTPAARAYCLFGFIVLRRRTPKLLAFSNRVSLSPQRLSQGAARFGGRTRRCTA
jgi:hypothetical protein